MEEEDKRILDEQKLVNENEISPNRLFKKGKKKDLTGGKASQTPIAP